QSRTWCRCAVDARALAVSLGARRKRRAYIATSTAICRVMPTQIAQIDLAVPLVPITIEKRYTALWVLVKFGPQPLGWIRCSRRSAGSRVSPDMLSRMIADTLPL